VSDFETRAGRLLRVKGSQPLSGKPEGKKPGKHRYVSGFHRGLELYGGHATRLQEPWVKESLNRYGLVIVEGMKALVVYPSGDSLRATAWSRRSFLRRAACS